MKREILAGKRAALLTLGCKVNQYESDAMARLLEEAGAELVDFSDGADIYIVNTCSVTNIADRKSRQMLHRAKKRRPDSVVVACGCYVQADKEHALADYAVDLILGNNVKKNIVELLEEYFENRNMGEREADEKMQNITVEHFQDISKNPAYETLYADARMELARAYVKVQDGCNQFCSYCIIPYTRGRVRSRKPEAVVEEVRQLAENGYREIVLTGIHLSSYGLDIKEGQETSLSTLIAEVSKVKSIMRVRLGSLEPRIITEDFLDRLKKNDKFCPHFHLSLQSACNDTLKRMNRKYTIEEYMEKCDMIRRYFDRPAITTDVIVGFPGETEEEFQTTVENLERLKLYEMHVFKFSPRKKTVAEKLPDQIPEQIKSCRSEILLAMSKKHQEEYEKQFLGQELTVLTEEQVVIDGVSYGCGHTKNYIKALFPWENVKVNTLVRVRFALPYAQMVDSNISF